MGTFRFRLCEEEGRTSAVLYFEHTSGVSPCGDVVVRADSRSAFVEALDLLHAELDDVRREIELRWAEREARLYLTERRPS